MNGLAVVALCVAFVAVVWARPDEEKYTDQFDAYDVDEVLDTQRLREAFYNCLKTGTKCTKEAQTLRDILPDALKTACSKCTEVQKTQAEKVFRRLCKDYPKEFLELESIFDPEHVYRTKYAKEAESRDIHLPPLE